MRARRLLFPAINRTAWEEFDVPEPPEPHSVVARAICSLVSPGTAGRDGTDHLFLVTRDATQYVSCTDAPLSHYRSLVRDVLDRTETAMPQAHCFKVMELALTAQADAVRLA